MRLVEKTYAKINPKKYKQDSIKKRIEAAFLDNIGKILTRADVISVARDPINGTEPENWHQRLSELRTDDGYTILSKRDRKDLKVDEYLMESPKKRKSAQKRLQISPATWQAVLERANFTCEWVEDGIPCKLQDNHADPIGGGTVRLTPDHKTPHSINPKSDPKDPNCWQALCGRHQVMKKNYWDNTTGKMNLVAIIQAASLNEKKLVYAFLKKYFKG